MQRQSIRNGVTSTGVLSFVRMSIRFDERGVRVDGRYYVDALLMHSLLPEIRELSEYFIFLGQDSALPGSSNC